MAVYRRSSRTRNVIAVLVLAALTLITIDARSNGTGVLSSIRSGVSDAFGPLQRGTHTALAPIGDFLTGAVHYGSLRSENQRLRQQIAELQTQSAQAQAEQQQAEQVLKDQNLPFLTGIPTVTVQIIDYGSSNFDTTVTIDRGTANGIAAGQPVVAAGGLVGTVLTAAHHSATVELLTDPSFDVGVSLQGGNVGSAEGTGRGHALRVTVINAQVNGSNLPGPSNRPGDMISTSGLSMEKFPKSIPVGRVSKVTTVPGAAEPEIEITPLVNPTQLSYLEVLIWSPQ